MTGKPHGGRLVQVREHADPSAFAVFSKAQRVRINREIQNTITNVANGVFSPLDGFSEFPDLGITPLFFRRFHFCVLCGGIASEKTCPHGEANRLTFSGPKLLQMFAKRETPPKEFTRPEVAKVILESKSPFVE